MVTYYKMVLLIGPELAAKWTRNSKVMITKCAVYTHPVRKHQPDLDSA